MGTSSTFWNTDSGRPLLGANGTEAMASLLTEGKTNLADYMKVGPFMGHDAIEALAWSPLLLHLDDPLSAHAPLSAEQMERIESYVMLTRTPWISEHIGFGVANTAMDDALITQPASALLARDQALENIICNAADLASRASVPLLLENIPFFPNLAHVHVTETEFINQVIDATDCNLLLDLAHARVSASVLGIEVHEYLRQLPLERTVEIHISGPRRFDELDARRHALVEENARSVAHLVQFGPSTLVDAHELLRDEDYALLEWTLAECRPRAISLEYYRDPLALETQLQRLGALLGRPATS